MPRGIPSAIAYPIQAREKTEDSNKISETNNRHYNECLRNKNYLKGLL